MAQYWWSAADAPVQAGIPSGWTNRFATSATHEVITDATSPEGRSWRIVTTAQARRFLSFDAVSGDADRATAKVAVLVKYQYPQAFAYQFAPAARGAGSAGSETALAVGVGAFNSVATLAVNQYISGALSALVNSVESLSGYVDQWIWIVATFDGTSVSITFRTAAAPDTVFLSSGSITTSLTAAGWVGLFNFANSMTWDVAAFAVATGADDIFFEEPVGGTTAVNFTGTVPTLNGTEDAAFSESVASYFSGTETPFTYAVHAGTLPAGLSLNTSTGVISGTPTTAGTSSGIVIRATDATPNTADTNAFDVVISAAAAVVSFTGTVPAQSWVENAAITPLDLSSYFFGDLTPFTYAVTTGTLPVGLSLNTATGVISGTPTTPAAAVSIVVTATDTGTNTAATNAFNVTITAAAVVVKGVRVTLHTGATAQASITGITARWWDSATAAGAPLLKTDTATTDATGLLELNIDAVTALDVAGVGYLSLYKVGADIQSDLHFASRIAVQDIA